MREFTYTCSCGGKFWILYKDKMVCLYCDITHTIDLTIKEKVKLDKPKDIGL